MDQYRYQRRETGRYQKTVTSAHAFITPVKEGDDSLCGRYKWKQKFKGKNSHAVEVEHKEGSLCRGCFSRIRKRKELGL